MTKSVKLALILLVLGFLSAQHINAQTTEIAYQGSLKVSGLAANANYDFEFRLYDAVSGGTQVGALIPQNGVSVVDGVFSVRLDFGQNFPGSDRFLEIAVRPSGGGGFTFLNPRQKIASAPYAIRSNSAGSATSAITAQNSSQLGGVAAAQYVVTSDVRLSDSRNPIAGSPSYIQNTNSQQASSNFNVSGTGTANVFNAASRYNFNGNHLISANGIDNVFVGAGAGLLNTGNTNTFTGANAGFENKGGSFNAFFGAYSGKNNVTGNNNSFYGYFSGNATTSGSDNSFFGNRSGQANTSGALNSFFGTFSGLFNTTGSDNSFFGNSAGFNSNGNRNSFFGSQAGNLNTTGSDNSFLGSFAGRANTTGSNNAFVGSSAGSLNATGLNNSFFGSNAGFTNTASGNSFFGMDSGFFNNTGANNSFFGKGAGRGNTVGELNLFLGVDAGNSNTIGTSNTIVGAGANVLSGNLVYATALGAEAVVATSNTVVLGRPTDGVRIPGNLNVLGTLFAPNLNISAANITGVIGTANGGTGLALAGANGNFLRSNGTAWLSSPLTVGDILAGSSNYIQNTSVQQGTSNFNISGNGIAGGMLTGNAINAVTQFNINGSRILSNAGIGNLFAGAGSGVGNTTGGSNAFFGSSAGALNSSASGNSFFGANAGTNTSSGNNNTLIGVNSGQTASTGANNSFLGANTGQTNTIGTNNTLVGSNANVGANNLTYATAIGSDAVVSTNNSVVLGRTVDTVSVPGNLNVQGALTATTFVVPAANLTGVVATANGGTGLNSSGGPGNYLRSNGSSWVSSAIAAGDLPAGNGNYIQNGIGLQTGSFNVSGAGTVGGLFSANTVNSTTQYNLNGTRVFAANGINNLFLGAGTATTGDSNTFIGANTALSNTTGTSNTILGAGANVGLGNLIFATALGSGAIVNDNNSIVLGRTADTVRVPGNLTVAGTFTAASFTLPAANITGILAPLNGGTGINSPGGAGNVLRSNGTIWTSSALQTSDIPNLGASYIQNGIGVQASSNFNISGNGTIGGNLNVSGSITGGFSVPAANIVGTLGRASGGTGLNLSGASGNFLRSDGLNWTSSALSSSDIPTGSANYIQNGLGVQSSSNFNISGTGTVGGLFSANAVNSTTQYNIGGNRVFSVTGTNNVFVGADTATTGSSNTFVGDASGAANTTGTSNTLLGANADVSVNSLSFASAVGAGAIVGNSNSVVLGRGVDTVRVPGNLVVTGTFTAATFTLPAANITGTLAAGNGGTGLNASGTAGNFLRSNGTVWTSSVLTSSDIAAGSTNYVQNGITPQAGTNFNIAGNGAIGGNLSVGGTITGAFSVPAGNITGILGMPNGGTGLSASGLAGNVLRSNGTNWASSALIATDIPNLAAGYIQNGTGTQALSNFNISGNGIVGTNLTVGGNLAVTGSITGTFSVPATNITGSLLTGNGGTGLNAPGINGNFLRSNGTSWFSSTLAASDIPGGSTGYIQNGTGTQALSNFNISGSGTVGTSLTVGGNLAVTGSITGGFSVPAGNITGVLGRANGGTGLSAAGTTGNFLRSNGTDWTSLGLSASDIPTGSTGYIQNGITPQTAANFNIAGNGTIGSNLTVTGNLTVNGAFGGSFTVPAANITGTVGAASGGTGLASSGSAGQVLRSNGTTWTSSLLQASDIPSLGGTYIQNGTTTQASSDFNISGTGTAGTLNAITQYNIGGNRVFATSGTNNVFAGPSTGTGGSGNAFFGANAGTNNATGSNNTVIGWDAEVGSGTLSNATAIGAKAQVDQSNSIVLGGVTGTNGGTSTKVGIGTTTPKTTLDVTGGNILVGTPGQGIILKSPDGGTCKLLTIDNSGAIALLPTGCP